MVHNGSPCEECGALITDEPERPLDDGHPYHVAVFDSGTGEMLGWRPLREPKIDEETRAELDAILKEANEKVECICIDGWVRTCPLHPMFERSTYLQERAED